MKTLIGLFIFATFSAPVLADEQDNAKACFTWGINKMAQNPEGQQQLKQLTLVMSDINTERYDENIGSQHIATQLTAPLEKDGNAAGKMLCLLENEQPLYVYFNDYQ